MENKKFSLFKSVKYKISGFVNDEIIQQLKIGGAEGFSYFSDYVTHCVVGEDPSDSDISDANDLYEVPAVISDWVRLSMKCGKLLPIQGFCYGPSQLFFGVNACLSQVSAADARAIWAMVKYNGGKCSFKFTCSTTHLIVGKPTGAKYERVMRNNRKCVNTVDPVTPDWVLDSIRGGSRCGGTSYHPRLLTEKPSAICKLAGSISTAHITGFVDGEISPEENVTAPVFSNELLEQLKQRMPWNQAHVISKISANVTRPLTHNSKVLQSNAVSAILPLVCCQVSPGGIKPVAPQHQITTCHQTLQQQEQLKPQQVVQQTVPAQWRLPHTSQLPSQQQQQHILLSQQMKTLPPQFILRDGQRQCANATSITSLNQPQSQMPLESSSYKQIHPQVHPQTQQQIMRQQIQQRISLTQCTGADFQRQSIRMDAQTHVQLQQMDPQQRGLFLQGLQKQRQLILQRQLQGQQNEAQHQHQTRQGGGSSSPTVDGSSMALGVSQSLGTSVVCDNLSSDLNSQQLQWIRHRHLQQINVNQNPQLQQALLQQQILHQEIQQITVRQLPSQQQPVGVTNSSTDHQAAVQPSVSPNEKLWQEMQLPKGQLALLKRRQHHMQNQLALNQPQEQNQKAATLPTGLPCDNQDGVATNRKLAFLFDSFATPVQSSRMIQYPESGDDSVIGPDEQDVSFSGIVQDVFPPEGSACRQLCLFKNQQHQPPFNSCTGAAHSMHSSSNIKTPQRTTLGNVGNVSNIHSPCARRGPSVVTGAKSLYIQTAARVAAVLTKSAAATEIPGPSQPYVHFFGHEQRLKLPTAMHLRGCIFLIVEYDCNSYDVPLWQQVISENGGDVETSYSLRVTHILCQTQKHPLVQQGLRDGKRCITADWLSDTTAKQQVLPPWLALHFPTPFSDEKPCRNLVISYSEFEGEERIRVKKMIDSVGAKTTSYYSSHNHILVCRRPNGEKYRKAREWGKCIVNVTWLNEILFGHYSCLNQADSHMYQQFNLENPFCIDYALVPHLMAAWNIPINVKQESCDRVKSSRSLTRGQKRPWFSNASLAIPDSDQENKVLALELPVYSLNALCAGKRPYVVFSGVDNSTEEQNKVWQLGGIIAKNCKEATHLLMSKPQRTLKLLCCLSTCKYILTLKWLSDSHKQNMFLSEDGYSISDSELEKAHDFSIPRALRNPERNELFNGKIFYITPGVVPSISALRQIIECAGGTVDKQRKSLKQIQEFGLHNYLIVTVSNDLHLVTDLLSANVRVYNTEFVMSAVMKQKIDYDL